MMKANLNVKEVELLDRYFRLCNYMSVAMLYLKRHHQGVRQEIHYII